MESQQALQLHDISKAVIISIQRKVKRDRRDIEPNEVEQIKWHTDRAERMIRRYQVLIALN